MSNWFCVYLFYFLHSYSNFSQIQINLWEYLKRIPQNLDIKFWVENMKRKVSKFPEWGFVWRHKHPNKQLWPLSLQSQKWREVQPLLISKSPTNKQMRHVSYTQIFLDFSLFLNLTNTNYAEGLVSGEEGYTTNSLVT